MRGSIHKATRLGVHATGAAFALTSMLAMPLAHATTVSIDTSAARSVLKALANPNLTMDSATAIVRMPGNQGIIRKLQDFGLKATTESFASALYATAHGRPADGGAGGIYELDDVKAHAPETRRVVEAIDRDPAAFQQAIEARIVRFSPPGAHIRLRGYVVAAGDGGGYTFGGSDFYLNAARLRDVALAKAVTEHELYHAVQGSYADARKGREAAGDTACNRVRELFNNLYEEGTANVVEDPAVLATAHGEAAERAQTDIREGMKHLGWSASLLEMSVDALNATQPMSYDDVYAVGFYGHGILYMIATRMVEDIVKEHGPAGVIALLRQPSDAFILGYTHLRAYGADADHPKLGPATIRAAEALAAGCR